MDDHQGEFQYLYHTFDLVNNNNHSGVVRIFVCLSEHYFFPTRIIVSQINTCTVEPVPYTCQDGSGQLADDMLF